MSSFLGCCGHNGASQSRPGENVPRIAEARPAAEPSSPRQRERHRQILSVTARLAQAKGFDGVQMHDVAKDSGVAIATLYRYFPSKTHLFTALMKAQVDRLADIPTSASPGQDPVEAVRQLLIAAQRRMLQRPLLASAILQSNTNAHAATVPDAVQIDTAFSDLVLRTLQVETPTAEDVRLVRLLTQSWYGALSQCLNGRLSVSDAEGDLGRACELLLAPRSTAGQPAPARG